MARSETIGTIYLLHFDRPYRHAEHYLGWAIDHVDRIDAHLNGTGSPLVRAAVDAGIHVELVRTWEGVDRNLERRLKSGTLKRHCPICKPGHNAREAARMRRLRERRRHGEEATD